MTVKRGDVFRHVHAGAGGWGDPLEREPAAVLKDVRNELLSIEKAAADYGVVVDARRWRVDEPATRRRRDQIRAARGWSELPKVQRHDPVAAPRGGRR
jgi:N-methylhydantoinase B